jgi:hypothetical protein
MADKNVEKYQEYFKQILDEIEAEFRKSNEYSQTIDEEINKFRDLLGSKGSQHFLVEHVRNAIELQSQRQSLIKDKFNVRKAVLDYAMKSVDDDAANKNLFAKLSELVKMDKEAIQKLKIEVTNDKTENIDNKIDELLSNSEEEES